MADWDDLRVFLAVARAESLSAAGRVLKCDAATVGRRIARFEEAMGAKLFVKSPQGYALSTAGARLVAHAEQAEQAMAGAREAVSGEAGALSGQLRIGAPDGCANYLLPQVCTALVAAHPGLEIQIVALPRVFNLSKREADMAIAVSRPSAGRLTVQKLTDYRLHLAAHHDYLAQHPEIKAKSDLKGHRMVGYIPDMIFDKELDYMAEAAGGAAGAAAGDSARDGGGAPIALTSNSVSVQMQMLRAGAGLGIVHDFALPFTPGVTRILTDQVALTRTFWLIRHADDRRSERLSRIAEALGQGLRREVARLEGLAV